ncbi:zinc finger protein 414 [Thunnus albacares]|uniref:zinc finger protein 414 n=1 Tax=Thunnus albacares TaxID=8236 RepID=UPI001CF6821A|nr:zinc finger protein 414 [Thunnus albacares]
MSSGGTAVQAAENGNGVSGNQRIPCPLYGCKRVYTDRTSLERHVKDHEMPAQSLPGKVLLCSTVGCSGSFPNMQKLMEHMRHHHKPNIFFLCESCRTKLRSYRGLLTHLHTCSKVPRGKTKAELTSPQPAAGTNPNMTPMAMEVNPAQPDAVSTQQQLPSQTTHPDGSFPAAVPQPDSAAPPSLFKQEASSPQLTEAAQPDRPTAAPGPPDSPAQHQPQTRSPEPPPPAPASASHSPPGSAAMWKKNQGMACNRRILWEHTKGRYTCVQCGYTATNRKDMTQHINTQHNSNKPAEDTRSSVTNT